MNQRFWFSSFSAVLHCFSSSCDPIVTRKRLLSDIAAMFCVTWVEKGVKVQKKFIIGLSIVIGTALLSSCGGSAKTDAATLVKDACPLFMKDIDKLTDISAAAMLDPKWMPLAEAASFFAINKDSNYRVSNEGIQLELAKSQALIFAYCESFLKK